MNKKRGKKMQKNKQNLTLDEQEAIDNIAAKYWYEDTVLTETY